MAPTGFGKSAVALALGLLERDNGRVAILTSTKGLMDQYLREAGHLLTDIRGQNNYVCDLDGISTVDEGICHAGVKCDLKDNGCAYYDQYRLMRRSSMVITNYKYWLWQWAVGQGLGTFKWLIVDEAHAAPEEISSYLTVEFGPREWEQDLGGGPHGEDYKTWADREKFKAALRRKDAERALRIEGARASIISKVRHYRYLESRLERLAGSDGWVFAVNRSGWRSWSAVWPFRYKEDLFRWIPRVVFLSATIVPKTLGVLGIKESEYSFHSFPSSFPVGRRPIWIVPVLRLNANNTFEERRAWVEAIDLLIDARPNRRGIVHTVSYDNRDFILQNSRHGPQGTDRFRTHTPSDTRAVVDNFKNLRRSDAVLLSPALGTGWDFPGEECEFQIIAKLPIGDPRDPVAVARREQDRSYWLYSAAMELVQMAGRGMRAADDRCETFVIDEGWMWFRGAAKSFLPDWFREAIRYSDDIPPAPPLLRDERVA